MTFLNNPKSSITLRGSYFWIKEDEGAYLPDTYTLRYLATPAFYSNYQNQPPALRYTGWTIAIGGKVSF